MARGLSLAGPFRREGKRYDLAGIWKAETQPVMPARSPGLVGMPLRFRCRERQREPFCSADGLRLQRRIRKIAASNSRVIPFPDQIDLAVRELKIELHLRVFPAELRQDLKERLAEQGQLTLSKPRGALAAPASSSSAAGSRR